MSNIIEGTWTLSTSMSKARGLMGCVYAEGKIYCAGGTQSPYAGIAPFDLLEIFDIQSETWKTGPKMPLARSYIKGIAIGSDIYFFGGYDGNNPTTDVQIFDTVSEVWKLGPEMPTARYNYAASLCNNKIYIIGGSTEANKFLGTGDVYYIDENRWEKDIITEKTISGIQPVTIGNKIFFVGGFTSTALDIIQVYDTKDKTWSTSSQKMNTPRTNVYNTYRNNMIYITGGGNDLFEAYDVLNNVYLTGPSTIEKRSCPSAVMVGDRLYLIGANDKASVEYFSFADLNEYDIILQYKTESGIELKPDETKTMIRGMPYTVKAPVISGYKAVGYRINNDEIISGTEAVIEVVEQAYTIEFIYQPAESETDHSNCSCRPYIHIPICHCNKKMCNEIIDIIIKSQYASSD